MCDLRHAPSSLSKEMPFHNYTDFTIEMEFQSAKTRITELMDGNGISNILKENKLQDLLNPDEMISCAYFDEDDFIRKNRNGNSFLNCYSMNISSLPKHSGELACFLSALETNFDIILLTEIGARNISTVVNLFDGYDFFYVLPHSNMKGGIGVYLSSSIKNVSVKSEYAVRKSCTCCACEFESLIIEFTCNSKKFTLCGLYRHPSGNKEHFANDLSATLDMLDANRITILSGDTNVDLIKYENDENLHYVSMLFSKGYLPYVTLPTRITPHSATCIDHIFVKYPPTVHFNDILSGIFYSDISDHLPCFISFKINNPVKMNNRPFTRLYGEAQCNAFKENMNSFLWESLYVPGEDWYTNFIVAIKAIFEKSFPLVRVSRKRAKDKPWITQELKLRIKHGHRLFRQFLKTHSDNIFLRYKEHKNKLRESIELAEVSYYNELFENSKNSTRTLWKHLGAIISPKSKKGYSTIDKLFINGRFVTDKTAISNAMNEHFCTIGTKLQQKMPSSGNMSFRQYLPESPLNSFYLHQLDYENVLSEINKLNPRKAPGPDGIGAKVLHLCPEIFAQNLTYIFNKYITDGEYPCDMKIARVIALFKKGERHDPNNYRPISLLSCFNKIFEKLICKQLVKFLEKYLIFFQFQFGFRKGHSTILALIEIVDSIRRFIDGGNYVLGLFVDLTKAFDTVDHDILLYKLNHYGIRGHANRFFRSYLDNRKQFTLINGEQSTTSVVTCGVPQGSVLGPILFILYINDLYQAVGRDIARLFADDTGLFTFDSNLNKLIEDSKIIYKELFKWCRCNKLTVNNDKTCFVLFHAKNKNVPGNFQTIQIGEISFQRVEVTKYLGVFIDEKLNWATHVNYVCNSLLKYFGIFKKIKAMVSMKLARQLYFAFVYSRINYALEIYGACSLKLISKLQRIQNGLLKMLLCRNYRESTNVIHSDLNILKIKDIQLVNILTFVNNCLLGNCPEYFKSYFQHRNVRYNLRNHDLDVPWARTVTGSLSTRIQGAILWNGIVDKSHILKRCMKKHLVRFYVSQYIDN